jgi:hypothetical protein
MAAGHSFNQLSFNFCKRVPCRRADASLNRHTVGFSRTHVALENAFACGLRRKIKDGQSRFRAIVKASACAMQPGRRPSTCLRNDSWQKNANFPYLSADSG